MRSPLRLTFPICSSMNVTLASFRSVQVQFVKKKKSINSLWVLCSKTIRKKGFLPRYQQIAGADPELWSRGCPHLQKGILSLDVGEILCSRTLILFWKNLPFLSVTYRKLSSCICPAVSRKMTNFMWIWFTPTSLALNKLRRGWNIKCLVHTGQSKRVRMCPGAINERASLFALPLLKSVCKLEEFEFV